MTTTPALTEEQDIAMRRDMAEYESHTPFPLDAHGQTGFQIAWLSGYKACLEEERNSIKARIEAVQRGGGL